MFSWSVGRATLKTKGWFTGLGTLAAQLPGGAVTMPASASGTSVPTTQTSADANRPPQGTPAAGGQGGACVERPHTFLNYEASSPTWDCHISVLDNIYQVASGDVRLAASAMPACRSVRLSFCTCHHVCAAQECCSKCQANPKCNV